MTQQWALRSGRLRSSVMQSPTMMDVFIFLPYCQKLFSSGPGLCLFEHTWGLVNECVAIPAQGHALMEFGDDFGWCVSMGGGFGDVEGFEFWVCVVEFDERRR